MAELAPGRLLSKLQLWFCLSWKNGCTCEAFIAFRPAEYPGALRDQGHMEGRVKSRQGVPGTYVHQKRTPIRGSSKIRTHRKAFLCDHSSTACSNRHSACDLLLPLLVLSGLFSVWRRPRTPPREWGERGQMVYRGILKVLRCLPGMECGSNGFSASRCQSYPPPERDP